MKKFFLLFLVLFSHDAIAVKYGCLWTENLNFFDEELGIKTGRNGNVRLITEITPQKEYETESYDIENIHKELRRLSKEASGTSNDNFVTASLSFIIRNKNDHYYAINIPLKYSSKGLVFVSGFSEREGSKFKYICASKDSNVKKEENFTFQNLLAAFSERDFSSLRKGDDIIRYLERWMQYQRDAVASSAKSLQETLQQNDEALLEDFTSKINNQMQLKVEESRKFLGSIVDSEQLLLLYLKNNNKVLKNIFTEQEIRYESYRKHLLEEKREALKKNLDDSFKEILTHKTLTIEKLDLISAKEEFEALESVGLFYFLFHLHTTRELCKCCAASLASELRSNFLFKGLPSDTRMSFLISCSQILEGEDTDIRPSGIGKDQISEEIYSLHSEDTEEKILNFTPQENRHTVFQKILVDEDVQEEQEDDETLFLFD